ncbi:MAG: aldo/keto reductase, partial [Pedobacter sp.]
ELDKISAKHDTSLSAVSLAWLIARPSVTAPIASATSLTQLAEIEKAASLKLDEEDITALNKASDWHRDAN